MCAACHRPSSSSSHTHDDDDDGYNDGRSLTATYYRMYTILQHGEYLKKKHFERDMRAMFSLCLVLVVVFVSMVESRLGSQQRIIPPMGVNPHMMGMGGGYGFGT